MLGVSNQRTYFDLCWEPEIHSFWGLPLLSKKTTFIKNRVSRWKYFIKPESSQVILFLLNQVKSFSLSLSVTVHPVICMSLSYKSSSSPSVASKSSSVTCETSQISHSSATPSSYSWSSSSPTSFSTIIGRLTASCLDCLSSSSDRDRLTRLVLFWYTRPNTVTLSVLVVVGTV